MSTIPSVDLGMAAFSGIASANISIAVPVLSQNLSYVAIPDSRTGAACVWRSAVSVLTPTFSTRSSINDSGPFSRQRLVALIRLTSESIYFNTEMSDSEKCMCLERIFIRQSMRDRIRVDGQNNNDYSFDFKVFWSRKMSGVFLPDHYLTVLTNAKRY